ncbi:hypothetical protein MTR_1g064750 [Medicago truncatula]|uniref:Uncharacterized protein n=1 Tax=Medicago truncatula TaxID=3880 RepID=A0A072VLF5_MEDTR|nr:hypothetical protein MTR_1g064750 [Medicago truncatula]
MKRKTKQTRIGEDDDAYIMNNQRIKGIWKNEMESGRKTCLGNRLRSGAGEATIAHTPPETVAARL